MRSGVTKTCEVTSGEEVISRIRLLLLLLVSLRRIKQGKCRNINTICQKCHVRIHSPSLLQLLVQLEELALVPVAVALGAALVAHWEPAAGAAERVVDLRGTSL